MKIKPKQRQLFLVVDRDNDPKEVQLYDSSFGTFGETLDDAIKDPDANGAEDFYRADSKGMYLSCTYKDDAADFGKFVQCTRITMKPRKEAIRERLLDGLPCLDELLKPLSFKKLEALMQGGGGRDKGGDDEDDEEDDEDRPRKRGRDKDEDDDDDDEPKKSKKSRRDDDEDDEPKRSKKDKKKNRPDDDDEDDDEDDDSDIPFDEDDDEDDEPKRSKKNKKRRDKDEDDDEDEDD